MERMEALTNYYTTHNEDARLTLECGMVEFLTTIHYVEKYLKTGPWVAIRLKSVLSRKAPC